MADRWAVAAGNWSNTATWNGGTLPTAADDVFADGRAVTIDQDITVLSIRTTQRSGGTAGGSFTAAAGTRVFSCNVISGTTDCLIVSAASSNYTVNGNVTGGSAANADGMLFSAAATTTLTINGNVTGGSAATAFGVNHTGAGTSVIAGTITGGTNSTARGVNQSAGICTTTGSIVGTVAIAINIAGGTLTINTSSITVTGTASAIFQSTGVCTINCSTTIVGSTSVASGIVAVSGAPANCLINANVAGGSLVNQVGVALLNGGTTRINGNVTAGGNATAHGVTVSQASLSIFGNVVGATGRGIQQTTGTVLVVGNVTGGSNAAGDGIFINNTTLSPNTCTVNGTITGGSVAGAFGIENTGASPVNIFGNTVAGVAAATSNTGSGSITVVSTGGGGGGSSLPLIGPGGLVY